MDCGLWGGQREERRGSREVESGKVVVRWRVETEML